MPLPILPPIDLLLLASLVLVCVLSLTRAATAASAAPAATIAAGLTAAIIWRLAGGPVATPDLSAGLASAGLAVLGFASAAQVRASRFAPRSPISFKLTLAAAPIYFLACALTAFIMLPHISFPAALLLGAALMLNGAAFDRQLIATTSAPKAVRSVVRAESAAVIALGVPAAVLATGYATAASPSEPALGPLLSAALGLLNGFAFGGVLGLLAARTPSRLKALRLAGAPAAPCLAAILAFIAAPYLGANAIIAATAVGLLWGEQTDGTSSDRRILRRRAERLVMPAAYFGFGVVLAPRLFEADLLSLFFAIAAATVLRAGPRLAVLQNADFPRASQNFLAWYGGAPGAATALFLMTLVGNPAIVDAEGVLTIGALSVVAGVVIARVSAKPLVASFLKETAIARRRIRPA
ncbi:MAG: hypothetical protein AAF224_09805 [Pseudomonadota bacterium]